jgi:polysaccharide pyruvyl transferase WcaK-like protein
LIATGALSSRTRYRPKNDEKIVIVLLTNRDSDNVGDQLIEACDISLIECAMKNLGFSEEEFEVRSHAASIINKKYLKTGDPEHIKRAHRIISAADLLIFGGAPLFNYQYQLFYKRTIKTLEMADQYQTPAVFSAIGIEDYSEQSNKCQDLKQALNRPSVTQITTRDDFDALQKYVERPGITIAKVADPAVFVAPIFEDFLALQPTNRQPTDKQPSDKRSSDRQPSDRVVGLFPARTGMFVDNNIEFSESQQLAFWQELVTLLEANGFDYRLLSTGHFSDEVFLELLLDKTDIDASKFVFNIDCPEKLVSEISSYCGIVSYRLHASVTAYALGIPSIGLVWNQKISMFYDAINQPGRAFVSADWTGETVGSALMAAISSGVKLDSQYAMSVYRTIHSALRKVFKPRALRRCYSYRKLVEQLPRYQGTTVEEQEKKTARKLKRLDQNSRSYKGQDAVYLSAVRQKVTGPTSERGV